MAIWGSLSGQEWPGDAPQYGVGPGQQSPKRQRGVAGGHCVSGWRAWAGNPSLALWALIPTTRQHPAVHPRHTGAPLELAAPADTVLAGNVPKEINYANATLG